MGKKTKLIIALVCAIIALAAVFSIRTCNRPVTNPAVKRLQDINDSLYQIIQVNNSKTDSLFAKIDSMATHQDTIIQRQEITNQIYRNETYNILNSDANRASTQFRATLKKSDSLLKAGFYTRTYNLRSATFQSQLQ
jgi:hypothetical protein